MYFLGYTEKNDFERDNCMGRGKKTIDGQLSFDFILDANKYVCQANTLITGRQALKLNSAKLIRAAIMQIKYDDKELKPYVITIGDLSDLLGVSSSNVYRDIDEITDDIINNPVFIKSGSGSKMKWIKIPWVSKCEYQADIGVALKLNDELKPLLLNLKEKYTQYTLDNILTMKSVYAIRIFEMMQEKLLAKALPKKGVKIEMSIEQIRECCDCIDKYKMFSNLKKRVIDAAVNEINRVTLYHIEYDYIKQGRAVIGICFYVNMKYH